MSTPLNPDQSGTELRRKMECCDDVSLSTVGDGMEIAKCANCGAEWKIMWIYPAALDDIELDRGDA